MKYQKVFAVLSFSIASNVFAVNGSLHSYTTGFIPFSYGGCDVLKTTISESFSRAANVRTISAQCETTSRGNTVKITYATENNDGIEITTTKSKSDYDDLAGRGYMKTQKECEERKESVTNQFITATGLTPFFVNCVEDPAANMTNYPWSVGIDAVGIGRMNYQYIDRLLSDGLTTSESALISEIKRYFGTRSDTVLLDSVYRTDTLEFGRVGIAIFSQKRLEISKRDGLSTRSSDDCSIEADELKTAANRGGLRVVGHGCALHRAKTPVTFVILESTKRIFFDSLGITYENMAACRAARQAVFEDMRQTLGEHVIGIACADGVDAPTAFLIQKEGTPQF